MSFLPDKLGFRKILTRPWVIVLVVNLIILFGVNLWAKYLSLFIRKNSSGPSQTTYQTDENINLIHEKLGTLEPVKIINKYLLIDTSSGKQPISKIVYSNYTLKPGYFKYVYENFDDYVLFLDKSFVYKYNKNNKSLETINLPLEVVEKINFSNGHSVFFDGVSLTKDLVIVNFNMDYAHIDTYLLDLKTNKFTRLDTFSQPENCPRVYCTGPSDSYKLSDKYFVLLQGTVNLCWSKSSVYLFNLKNRSITKIIDPPIYCSKNPGNHEFLGAFDNKVYMATYVDILDKNIFSYNPIKDKNYTSLFSIDVFSSYKKVLMGPEDIPKDAKVALFDVETASILFYVDDYSYYRFDLKNESIKPDLQRSSLAYYEKSTSKDSLRLKVMETYLSEITEEEQVDVEDVALVSLAGDVVLLVKGNQSIDYVSTQHWAKLYADYLARRNSNEQCSIIGDLVFKNVSFDKEKKLVFYSISANANKLPTLLCDADIKNTKTLTRLNYEGYINLQTGEVFLEI